MKGNFVRSSKWQLRGSARCKERQYWRSRMRKRRKLTIYVRRPCISWSVTGIGVGTGGRGKAMVPHFRMGASNVNCPPPPHTHTFCWLFTSHVSRSLVIKIFLDASRIRMGANQWRIQGGVTWVMPPWGPGAPQAYQGHHRPIRGTTDLTGAPQTWQGHHRPVRSRHVHGSESWIYDLSGSLDKIEGLDLWSEWISRQNSGVGSMIWMDLSTKFRGRIYDLCGSSGQKFVEDLWSVWISRQHVANETLILHNCTPYSAIQLRIITCGHGYWLRPLVIIRYHH